MGCALPVIIMCSISLDQFADFSFQISDFYSKTAATTAKKHCCQVSLNCLNMTIITSVPSGTYSLEKALKHCRSLPQGCVLNHDGLIMQHFLISSAYKAYLFLGYFIQIYQGNGYKNSKANEICSL